MSMTAHKWMYNDDSIFILLNDKGYGTSTWFLPTLHKLLPVHPTGHMLSVHIFDVGETTTSSYQQLTVGGVHYTIPPPPPHLSVLGAAPSLPLFFISSLPSDNCTPKSHVHPRPLPIFQTHLWLPLSVSVHVHVAGTLIPYCRHRTHSGGKEMIRPIFLQMICQLSQSLLSSRRSPTCRSWVVVSVRERGNVIDCIKGWHSLSVCSVCGGVRV